MSWRLLIAFSWAMLAWVFFLGWVLILSLINGVHDHLVANIGFLVSSLICAFLFRRFGEEKKEEMEGG